MSLNNAANPGHSHVIFVTATNQASITMSLLLLLQTKQIQSWHFCRCFKRTLQICITFVTASNQDNTILLFFYCYKPSWHTQCIFRHCLSSSLLTIKRRQWRNRAIRSTPLEDDVILFFVSLNPLSLHQDGKRKWWSLVKGVKTSRGWHDRKTDANQGMTSSRWWRHFHYIKVYDCRASTFWHK